MTLLFYPDAGDWVGRIRLGTGFSLTEAAESGTFSMSRVTVDDPDADITIVGHHAFRALETDCSWQTLFRGYFADRNIARAESMLLGSARQWDCTVYDINGALQFEVIRTGGKRPAETDTERLAWLLGSGFMGPVSSDDTHVLGYDVDLDETDYRGQTANDVLADCGGASGANWFAAYDESANEVRLHYYRPTRAYNSSSLSISNVLAEADGLTVFAPSSDMKLQLDPSRIYSGVYYQYGEKQSAVYETSGTVLASIGHKRETREEDAAVRTAARATAKAQRYLAEADTDLATIAVTLRAVPPSQVNLVRAGQRIQIKATHLPGFTSATWLRVIRRTVEQDGETQLNYRVTLELADPKQVGLKVRHAPSPVPPDSVDGASVAFTRNAFTGYRERDDCVGGLADDYDYGVSPPGHTTVMSASEQFTPGIQVGGGCNSPAVGYSGIITDEQWLEIDGTPSADAVGLKVTYTVGTVEGVAAGGLWSGGLLTYGVASSAPASPQEGQFTPLGTCSADTDDSFVVPLSLVGTGEFIVIGPGWQCSNLGNACSDEVGDPVVTGAGNSGRVDLDTIAITEVTIAGSGETLWRPLDGAIDGSNRTYTLTDWNGRGVPRLRIGPVEYALGTDYTVDRDALTATFRFAPWEGADLNGRWNV